MATTAQWRVIRPWAPSLRLVVREITSVSATFILSSSLSDRESDPSLASRGLTAASEQSDLQESEPVASSSAIPSSLCSITNEESLKSQTRSFIADALANGLSVTVNGSPWPRAFIRIDEKLDEAVIIIYALMPGRQYDVELGLIPNDQQSSNNNDATIPHLNSQITTEDDSDNDNTPSEIQTDPESPSLDHSIPSDRTHSTPSTSPSRTVPGTPATVPPMSLEEKLKHLQEDLTAVNEERETLLATLKSMRKDSQKADSALRSEMDTLKRTSERHAIVESKGRQKILALQEAVKRAQNATREIEAKVKELEAEMPDLNKAKDEKEQEYATLKKVAEKVRKEREVLEEREKKRQEAVKADLAGLTVKLEKLGAKKERLDSGIVPELEQKLKEIEKEIEDEEQNLLKWNADAQNRYQQHQLIKQQRQRHQQQQKYHTHNYSEGHHPSAFSVPIQRPRYHSSEFPTPIARPTPPAPIQRPTKQSDLSPSNLGYSTATSTIWAPQHPVQRQESHSQISQQSPISQQQQHTLYSPRLQQLNNPRPLSFHSKSMVVTPSSVSGGNLMRRSSLMNPVSVPFSPSTNHHSSFNATTTTPTTPTTATTTTSSGSSGSNTPSYKSVTSSPPHASMIASSSTLSSKAPAFEPTGLTFGCGGGIIPNSNVTPKRDPSTSPIMSKGKESSTTTTPLPAPIQRPVTRATSGSGGSGSGRRKHSQWNYSGVF